MSTLMEIEAAVEQLSRAQQQELYTHLGTRLASPPQRTMTREETEAWLETARGVGISGMTTDEIMKMTRGEE